LLIYQMKIEIKPYKQDEFVNSMRSFLPSIRKEKGCLDFSVYQDSEKENTYIVVGEWKTRQAMEKHFQTHEFQVLIGAARVLGETFAMNIAEVIFGILTNLSGNPIHVYKFYKQRQTIENYFREVGLLKSTSYLLSILEPTKLIYG